MDKNNQFFNQKWSFTQFAEKPTESEIKHSDNNKPGQWQSIH